MGVSVLILLLRKSSVMLGIVIVVLAAAILTVNIFAGGKPSTSLAAGESANDESIEVNRPVGDKDEAATEAPSQAPQGSTGNTVGAGKVVVIDAGHGGEDPGAVSNFSGAKEKDITLIIAEKAKALLEEAGYKVIMTRSEDVLNYDDENASMTKKRRQDLLKRKKIMDESGADIVVSIHLNAFTDEKYSGAQVFYTKESLSSKKLAMSLQQAFRDTVDPNNEREALKKNEDIIITKNCKVTTVIAECGFLSNQAEEAQLVDDAYQSKLALAIKKGIDGYFAVSAE